MTQRGELPCSDQELPTCERCGARGMHNLVILANEARWYLCNQPCLPYFLKASRDWLRQQKASLKP